MLAYPGFDKARLDLTISMFTSQYVWAFMFPHWRELYIDSGANLIFGYDTVDILGLYIASASEGNGANKGTDD